MASKSVILQLPEALYNRFQRKAEQSQRTIEDELLEVVSKANLPGEGLPVELAEEIAAMSSFSDQALWKAARKRIPSNLLKKLNQLNYKQQKEGAASLTSEELKTLNELGYQHDR